MRFASSLIALVGVCSLFGCESQSPIAGCAYTYECASGSICRAGACVAGTTLRGIDLMDVPEQAAPGYPDCDVVWGGRQLQDFNNLRQELRHTALDLGDRDRGPGPGFYTFPGPVNDLLAVSGDEFMKHWRRC